MTSKSARLMPLGSSEIILDEWEKITQTTVEESQKKSQKGGATMHTNTTILLNGMTNRQKEIWLLMEKYQQKEPITPSTVANYQSLITGKNITRQSYKALLIRAAKKILKNTEVQNEY